MTWPTTEVRVWTTPKEIEDVCVLEGELNELNVSFRLHGV